MPKEGEEEIEKNMLTMDECKTLEDVPSIPFMISFNIPVVKVVTGDCWGGLLSAEGDVYTWGYNRFG